MVMGSEKLVAEIKADVPVQVEKLKEENQALKDEIMKEVVAAMSGGWETEAGNELGASGWGECESGPPCGTGDRSSLTLA